MRPESLLLMVALWRSLLFLPVLMVAFLWCRRLYGVRAAWLVLAMLLVEPTFAAHIPLAALDALGMGGIVVACYLAWRFFEEPSRGRLVAAACAVPFALLLKQTAIILPARRPRLRRDLVGAEAVSRQGAGRRVARRPAGAAEDAGRGAADRHGRDVGAAAVRRQPARHPPRLARVEHHEAGARSSPAGRPLHRLDPAQQLARHARPPFLSVRREQHDRVVVLLPGHHDLQGADRHRPAAPARTAVAAPLTPRFAEWSLFLPLLGWTALMLTTRINIGMRHFLPAYVFMLLLAGRSLRDERKGVKIAAWGALLIAALHVVSFHPNYVSYLNLPRDRVYLSISDSNLDWGQSLKQVRDWIDRRPQTGRPVHLLYFGDPNSPMRIRYYLRDRVTPVTKKGPLPTSGLLIASPVWVAGPFDPAGRYAALRTMTPVDVIGDSMLVYDLDRAGPGKEPASSRPSAVLVRNHRAQADLDAPVPRPALARGVAVARMVLAEGDRLQTLHVDAGALEQPDHRRGAGGRELPVARIAIDQAGADLDVVGVPADDDLVLGLLQLLRHPAQDLLPAWSSFAEPEANRISCATSTLSPSRSCRISIWPLASSFLRLETRPS